VPSERRPAIAPPTRVVLEILLIIVGVVFGLWILYKLSDVVLLLILAALFAYVIAPLVQLAERPVRIAGRPRRLSRPAAIALVYALMAASVAGAAALLLPSAAQQVTDMIARAPGYARGIAAWEHGWTRYYERLRIPPGLRQSIDQSVLAAGEAAVQTGRGALLAIVRALSNLPWVILIPILAFFLLKDGPGFRRAIVTALPHRDRLRVHRLFEDLNATLAGYIRAQLLACALVGSMCGLGFAVLGIPYPLLLGVLAGVMEFVPLVGPLLVAIVVSIVAALHAPGLALWAIAFLAILRLLEDYVIYPRLVGRGLHLHPLAVIVGVLAGADLAGVAGMFLAVPAVAVASVVYRHWREWRRGDEGEALPGGAT
jgi:predicted PurR-regulated permease PerM